MNYLKGVLEPRDFGLRISDFGLKIIIRKPRTHFKLRNPHSQTGNPPEGWESEGQMRNRPLQYSSTAAAQYLGISHPLALLSGHTQTTSFTSVQ
jgi:hypothetical protein